MPRRYRDIYPSLPLLDSEGVQHLSAARLMSVQYFQAEPGEMPHEVFSEHHVLLNLKEEPHRVKNWRNGTLRDFTFYKNEVIVTPAGVQSGWQWFAKSNVIVVTLDPDRVQTFAEKELGILLTDQQLLDKPQFLDADLVAAGVLLRDSIEGDEMASGVMFEAMSRVFLVKLLQKYGERRDDVLAISSRFTATHYKRVLAYVRDNLDRSILLENLASEVAMSPSQFSRVFKEVVGRTPMQFVLSYRVEQAEQLVRETDLPLSAVAIQCGFADQAHFSRSFKQFLGVTPRDHRASRPVSVQ